MTTTNLTKLTRQQRIAATLEKAAQPEFIISGPKGEPNEAATLIKALHGIGGQPLTQRPDQR